MAAEPTDSIFYVYKDYLGTLLTFTHETTEITYEQNFDAWGRYRNTEDWSYDNIQGRSPWLFRGYTGHEHLFGMDNWDCYCREKDRGYFVAGHDAFNLINMNGRLYDPVNGRMLSVDNYVQDGLGSQGYNRYTYAGNNPLKYTDPSGEVVASVIAGGALLGGTLNVLWQGLNGNINSGKDAGRAFLKGAWIGGTAMFGGGATLVTAGLAVASSWLPSINIALGSVGSISISPSIAFGTAGFNLGASVSLNTNINGLAVSVGFRLSGYSNNFAQNGAAILSGLETNTSLAIGYESENFSIMFGTNHFNSGTTSQQTGILSLKVGDFSVRYENDGSPFDNMGLAGQKAGGGTLSDSYRTAAISLGYKDFEIETRLFTGYRDMAYHNGPQMDGQAYAPHGYVPNPEINDYRAGLLSVGYKGYKVGINDDRVRHGVQNIFAHGLLSPQAYIPQMKLSQSFFEYKPRNSFTHW